MDQKKRNDLLVIAAVLLLAGVAALVFRHGTAVAREDAEIVITVDDREVFREKSAKLKLPYRLEVGGYEGGQNVFVIDEDETGTVGVSCESADCPDKICVHTGRVTLPDQPVVCLPHRITARIIKSS